MAATIPGAGITTPLTLTTADNTDTLTLVSTDTDANYGPNIEMSRPVTGTTNELLGRIDFSGQDAAGNTHNYFSIEAIIADATSGGEEGRFLLRTEVGGATKNMMDINGSEIVFNEDSADYDFRVEGNGNANMLVVDASVDGVGIGTATPNPFRLLVDHDDSNNGIAKFNHSNATPEGIRVVFSAAAPDNTSATFLEMQDSSALRLQIQAQGNVQNHDNSYGQISDERIKSNIKDANSQWDDIKSLKVRNFERKDDIEKYGEGKKVQIGLIAQECELVSPKLVNEQRPSAGDIRVASEFGTLYEDGDTIPEGKEIGDIKEVKEQVKAISYSVLYMKAIKALQEAMAKIETLETKVKALEEA